MKNHQQLPAEINQLTSATATTIASGTGTNQMTLPEFLADRDVTHLTGADIRFNGRYQQVFVLPKLIDHFIHNLQYAVIALRHDSYIIDNDHLAGTINLG